MSSALLLLIVLITITTIVNASSSSSSATKPLVLPIAYRDANCTMHGVGGLRAYEETRNVYVACGGGVVRVHESLVTPLLSPQQCEVSRGIVELSPFVFIVTCKTGVLKVDTQHNTTIITTLLPHEHCGNAGGIELVPSTEQDVLVACGNNGIVRIYTNGTVSTLINSRVCAAFDVKIVDSYAWFSCDQNGEYDHRMLRLDLRTHASFITACPRHYCEAPQNIARVSPTTSDILVTCYEPMFAKQPAAIRINGTNVTHITQILSSTTCMGATAIAVAPNSAQFAVTCSMSDIVISVPMVVNASAPEAAGVEVLVECSTPSGLAVTPGTSYWLTMCQGGDGLMVQVSKPILRKVVVGDDSSSVHFNIRKVEFVHGRHYPQLLVACDMGVFRVDDRGHSVLIVSPLTCLLPTTVATFPHRNDGSFVVTCFGGNETTIMLVEYNHQYDDDDSVRTTTLASSAECHQAYYVRADSNGTVYATCDEGVIAIYHNNSNNNATTTQSLIGNDVCPFASNLAIDESRSTLAVTCTGLCEYSVYRLHLDNRRVVYTEPILTWAVCTKPAGLTVDGASGDVYVSCDATPILRITKPMVYESIISKLLCFTSSSLVVVPGTSAILAACNTGVYQIHADRSVTQLLVTRLQLQSLPLDLSVSLAHPPLIAVTSIAYDNVFWLDPSCQGVGGYYDNQGQCQQCPLGTARPFNSTISACVECPAGRVAVPHVGAVTCTQVAAGTYEPGLVPRIVSFPCAPGTYSNTTGSTQCHQCSLGYYSTAAATTACKPCGFGTSSLRAAASCYMCPAGQYNNQRGGGCVDCPVGFVSPAAGSFNCEPCTRPSFSKSSALRQCDHCPTGKYAVFEADKPLELQECRNCPRGAECPLHGNMTVSSRFYVMVDASTGATNTYLCSGDRCDVNGACRPHRLPPRVNPLCGHCADGYSEWSGDCVACTRTHVWLLVVIIVIMWTCVLVYHSVSQSTSGALGITVYFWQVVLLIVDDRQVWISWARGLNMDFLFASNKNTACLFPTTPGQQLIVQLVAPLCAFGMLGASAMCQSGIVRLRRLQQRHRRRRLRLSSVAVAASSVDLRDYLQDDLDDEHVVTAKRSLWSLNEWSSGAYIRTTIALYFFTFNTIIEQCLQFLHCVRLSSSAPSPSPSSPSSARYMYTMPAVNCDEHEYRAMSSFIIVLLVLYLLVIPAILLVYLWSFYRRNELASAGVRAYFGVVYEPYQHHWFWWGMLQMARRGILVAVSVFLYDNDLARYGVISLCNVWFLCIQFISRPYHNRRDNGWESLSLTALVVLSTLRGMEAEEWWLMVVVLSVGCALGGRVLIRHVRWLREWWLAQVVGRMTTRRKKSVVIGGAGGGGGEEVGVVQQHELIVHDSRRVGGNIQDDSNDNNSYVALGDDDDDDDDESY